ncbi:glycolate oxidase [Tribonema minus]|uniref:Glycolate oxidase n=1 Tax=Tribonema minus TaxID=303371 RepID=A0A835ZFZ5_9STRA|nr:glycolate oxidase [Tribonema minus]
MAAGQRPPADLSKFISVDDFQDYARAHMDKARYEYVASGTEDEQTLQENRAAFKRFFLVPRFMRDVSKIDTAVDVLGHRASLPVLVSPAGVHNICHPQGEVGCARACARAGTIMAVSQHANSTLEEVAAAAGGAPQWFQLYILKDRALTRDIVRRAVAAGYKALVLTIDSARFGYREADARNGFVGLPEGLSLPNYPTREGYDDRDREAWDQNTERIFDTTCDWSEIAWLRSITTLPIVIKGVMAPEDATLAVQAGASCIIVSNHGGRALDGCLASIDALGPVVAAVREQCFRSDMVPVPVMMDGGVRRGTDVLKALALGATAVLLGRPVFFALATAGEDGVFKMLQLLRRELETAMVLTGCRSLAEIGPELVVHRAPYAFQRSSL